MDLLNIGFAILLVKMTICTLPGVLGIFCIASSEDTKRAIRSTVCNQLFWVSNAIRYPKFARFFSIAWTVLIFFSVIATWFVLLKKFF